MSTISEINQTYLDRIATERSATDAYSRYYALVSQRAANAEAIATKEAERQTAIASGTVADAVPLESEIRVLQETNAMIAQQLQTFDPSRFLSDSAFIAIRDDYFAAVKEIEAAAVADCKATLQAALEKLNAVTDIITGAQKFRLASAKLQAYGISYSSEFEYLTGIANSITVALASI